MSVLAIDRPQTFERRCAETIKDVRRMLTRQREKIEAQKTEHPGVVVLSTTVNLNLFFTTNELHRFIDEYLEPLLAELGCKATYEYREIKGRDVTDTAYVSITLPRDEDPTPGG